MKDRPPSAGDYAWTTGSRNECKGPDGQWHPSNEKCPGSFAGTDWHQPVASRASTMFGESSPCWVVFDRRTQLMPGLARRCAPSWALRHPADVPTGDALLGAGAVAPHDRYALARSPLGPLECDHREGLERDTPGRSSSGGGLAHASDGIDDAGRRAGSGGRGPRSNDEGRPGRDQEPTAPRDA